MYHGSGCCKMNDYKNQLTINDRLLIANNRFNIIYIFSFPKYIFSLIKILDEINFWKKNYCLSLGHTEHFTFDQDPMVEKVDITTIAHSFYSGLYAYNGWQVWPFISFSSISTIIDWQPNNPQISLKLLFCRLITQVIDCNSIKFENSLVIIS